MSYDKKFPVIEIFGSVVQGEGIMAGQQTMFVRFGGCDYRCSWCDSLHAVLPEQVKESASYLDVHGIMDILEGLGSHCRTVTLSGGNPAMHNLSSLVYELQYARYLVAIETQGTIWQDWIRECDIVTISPKPPSSEMSTDFKKLTTFFHSIPSDQLCVKIVVFDDADYEYALQVYDRFKDQGESISWYLQPGTDVMPTETYQELCEYRNNICETAKDIIDKACHDPRAQAFRILPQVHSLLYGHMQGV